MKKLNREELEKTAGGNIIDDIGCAFKGHELILQRCVKPTDHVQYSYYKCKRCGDKYYYKLDQWTGEETTISKKEFEAACN